MNRRYNPDVPIYISNEEEEHGTNKIGVKVVKKSGSESEKEGAVELKIETDIPLRWVMIRYCEQLGLEFQKTRFEFDGAKLREMDTPNQLAMVDDDVIYAFPVLGGSGHNAAHYVTLCIRVHKVRDTFLRVRSSTAILPQLMRCFPDSGPEEQGSLCFVYGGLKLAQNHVASQLNMVDGDIIDVFNYNTMSSSLSIVRPRITLYVRCASGNVTQFRVTRNTRVGQLMDKLVPSRSDLKSSHNLVRFIYCGRQLDPTKTVQEEQLNDGATMQSVFCLSGC